jgi:hypothetical protein
MTASPSDAPPHDPNRTIRPTVAQQCANLGVRFTNKRQAVLPLFDETPMPIVVEEVWLRARVLGLDATRSMIFRLAADLVKLGVLKSLSRGDRRDRLATPLSVPIEVHSADLDGPQPVNSAVLGEQLVELLEALGQPLAGRRIVISVID